MMAFNYVITIKKPNYKKVNSVSLLMLFFALINFIYIAINNSSLLKLNLFFSILIVLIFIFTTYISYKKKQIVYYRSILLLASVGFALQPKWNIFFAILYFVAAILEMPAKTILQIGVDENGILFTSFPKKYFSWNELNNVLLRDNILTVDYKSNKLFQKNIDADYNEEYQKKFNEFCKQHLNK